MPSNFVENPELNKLYLIRRNKSGTAAKRAQPGTIVELERIGHVTYVKIHWQYDGVIEDDMLLFYGLVKELSRKWIDMEQKRLTKELLETKKALERIEALQFIPSEMAKVTA
jgi:hypothetical protein